MYQAVDASCVTVRYILYVQNDSTALTTIETTGESYDKTYVSLAALQAWL